ncbi:MAG TPA: hypothetical protein DCM02_10985 [Flavobacterium sp.]|nr:hypothetical protein [Flavobacterium sp.]HAT75683.1 hypothetical protein [Flavobacterium sp.]HAT80953.1 hypothetical protein [Flavobacterium sp.]
METLTIDIINPRAKKLLIELMAMDLIKIRKKTTKPSLETILSKTRKYSNGALSLEEITKEVEIVRQKMYEERKDNT